MAATPLSSAHTLGPALACTGLRVGLGSRPVLDGVDWEVRRGQWWSVVGPNGAGKSTLLRAVAGLLPVDAGEVALLGRPLQAWPVRERAQALSWLGSGTEANDDLRARDLVMLGRLPRQGWLGQASPDDERAVDAALRQTHALPLQHRPVGQLSAGERQRVLLARALAVEAEVLLMDEPLAHLDPPHQADWLLAVRGLVAAGKTVVSVLHELPMALMADQILVLRAGRVAHAGGCGEPDTHAQIERVFDGRIRIVAVAGGHAVLPG